MTGFLIEIRRGPGRWLAPVLIVAGIVYIASNLRTLTLWIDTVAVLTSAPELMAPLAAGVAAWSGSRAIRRRTRASELLGRRDPASAAAAEIGAMVVWVFLAYLALTITLLILTAPHATWGGPSWLWLAEAGIGLITIVSIGWSIGRALPFRFTPFVVALASFSLAVWADFGLNGWWERLLPTAVTVSVPFDQVRAAPLWGQITWYIGVTVAVFAVVAVVNRSRRRVVVPLSVAAVLGLGGGFGVIAAGPEYFNDGRYIVWTCAGTDPQVCVHPAFANSLPEISRRAQRVSARLANTPFAISRFEQRPRAAGPAPVAGTASFGFDAPSAANYDSAAFEMATEAFRVGYSCFGARGDEVKPGLRPMGVLVTSVAGGSIEPVDPDRTRAWEWITAQSDAAMHKWIDAHSAAIRSCELSYSDFQ